MIGRRFGKLVVTRRGLDKKHWYVKCDCGNKKLVLGSNLFGGHTKGCGCGIGGKVKHGHCIGKVDAEYKMWMEARKRAREKGLSFSITIDDIHIPNRCPILGFKLKRGIKSGPTDTSPSLDRINPNRGYTKNNIWVISVKANRAKNNLVLSEVEKLYKALRKVWLNGHN